MQGFLESFLKPLTITRLKKILELANILKGAKFGVMFVGRGLIYSLENLEPLFKLMEILNEKANFHLIPMVSSSNTMGFNENLFAETGYVNSVKFENGTAKHGRILSC